MQESNLDVIQKSFSVQADNFESAAMNFSKEEYLAYTVSAVSPAKTDTVLEVASGTCACGRSLAPLVKKVICLDATCAMLEVGKREAEKRHIDNMVFVKGNAEELPLLDESFDIVISRLAFHHFTDIQKVFREMVRVLKPGGKLVLIDMEAAKEELRDKEDEIERWRDPSHVRNLSKAEILELFSEYGLSAETCESTKIPVALHAWMDLTKTPEAMQEQIVKNMREDLEGGRKTGFEPYCVENEIFFCQRWLLVISRK